MSTQRRQPTVVSSIDIGTNTVLMVTASVGPDGRITVLGDEHAIARMGRGVDEHRRIGDDAVDRVAQVLERYGAIARAHGAERIVAFGTSALRDAVNRDEVVAELARRTGIAVEVLSGDDEALWGYRGALFGLPKSNGPVAVLDIGGGSTEIAIGDGNRALDAVSTDIGAVRISERHLNELPPAPAAIESARRDARQVLAGAPALPTDATVVGVAGTVTTLGAIAHGMERFDAAELNGMLLSRAEVALTIDVLSELDFDATAAIPQISHGRADVILGGAIVLEAFMELNGVQDVVVSTAGVRYGMLMRTIEQR